MLEILLIHEHGMREIARQLVCDAARSAASGEYAYAIDNAEAVLRLAKHMEAPPQILVKSLVACALKGQGFGLLQMLSIQIHAKRPPDANTLLARIKTIVDQHQKGTDFYTSMDSGERFKIECTVMRMAYYGVDSQKATDRIPPKNTTYLRSCDWSKIVDNGNAFFDRTLELMILDDYKKVKTLKEQLYIDLKTKYGSGISLMQRFDAKIHRQARTELMEKVTLGLLLPAFDSIANARFQSIAQARLTYNTALLAEYSLEHGEYPRQIAELQVDPNSRWIIDPFTEASFHYQFPANDALYRLYSLGPNLVDDHGKAHGEVGADDTSAFLPNLEGLPFDPEASE